RFRPCRCLLTTQFRKAGDMASRGQAPVYNSRILQMFPSSRLRVWCVIFFFAQLAFASDWRKPAAQLAGKISATTGPGVIALEISNRSSVTAADIEQIRRLLVSELAS